MTDSPREELLALVRDRMELKPNSGLRHIAESDYLRALGALVGFACPHFCTDKGCSREGQRRLAKALRILRGSR